MSALLTALLVAVATAGAAEVPLQLRLIPAAAAARALCADGSRPGYYVRRGNTSRFVLYFEGGGWVGDIASQYQRAHGPLGSSKSWPPTMTAGGIFSSSADSNPEFATATVAYLKYCDSGSFAGNIEDAMPFNGTLLYNRGQAIKEAIVADLVAAYGMGGAADVVVSGGSAGGTACYWHADYVAAAVPRAHTRAFCDGAFFLPSASVTGIAPEWDAFNSIARFHNISTGAQLSAACWAALPAGSRQLCLMAPYALPHLQVPLFMAQSQLDYFQLTGILQLSATCVPEFAPPSKANCSRLQWGALQGWAGTFMGLLNASRIGSPRPADGGWLPTCIQHTLAVCDSTWLNQTVAGVTLRDAFNGWFRGERAGTAAWLADPPSWPPAHSCVPMGCPSNGPMPPATQWAPPR